MQFKFQSKDIDNVTITHEFEATTWSEALSQFVKFLKGSGYGISDDSVGVNVKRHPSFETLHNPEDMYNLCVFEE